MTDTCKLSIITLNCWGLKYIAKQRQSRIAAIAAYLAENDIYDVVFLQEIWCREDFDYIRRCAAENLPYSFHYTAGCVGTGLCLLCKYPLENFLYVPFQPNGYWYRIGTADWYAGKGLAVAQTTFHGCRLTLLTTHTHVETSTNEYVAHRIAQASAIADTLQALACPHSITILAGDLNSAPDGPLMMVLRALVPELQDCWRNALIRESHPSLEDYSAAPCLPAVMAGVAEEEGPTCDLVTNSWNNKKHKQDSIGSRIDYIFYLVSPGIRATVTKCGRPLPSRVPEEFGNCSYSDHEAVAATIYFEAPFLGQNVDFKTPPKVHKSGSKLNPIMDFEKPPTPFAEASPSTVADESSYTKEDKHTQQTIRRMLSSGSPPRGHSAENTLSNLPTDHKSRAMILQASSEEVEHAIAKLSRRFTVSISIGVFLLLLLLGTVWVPIQSSFSSVFRLVYIIFSLFLSMITLLLLFVHPVTTHVQIMALTHTREGLQHRLHIAPLG